MFDFKVIYLEHTAVIIFKKDVILFISHNDDYRIHEIYMNKL